MHGKRTRRQRLVAAVTAKALFVPRLFVVEDAALGQRFAALGAALSVQILITVRAVELVVFRDEAAGSYGLSTDGAFEALLVPVCAIILEARTPRLDRVLASFARLLKVSDIAVIAQDLVLVEGEFPV